MKKRTMYIGEVVSQLEGLKKSDLYYWEGTGLIHPRHVTRGKVDIRVYSDEDLETIKAIHHYTSQGFPPKVAYAKIQSEASGQPPAEENTSKYGALTTTFSTPL